ncbi:putative colanic acid biosysnthesis UDP-glucose lipid carrier transferase [Methylomagnum ishizawai]|uniref:Putative colanic acid biosysnthesis UDP-glucose lipid carrier transferase n=1 Tax=Methylomagnum ishizawai TaxID=1760988 RepID=A0A1Y6D4R3_9GAMM|nr:undecaprenyl-phosphate glucose phosphotransferase [Methylomagnum ishizawai]SMF97657.1 putative colanic acid biosysnthesis UDP-glucose lipid carrier transferase [Methylomagnum ishizawai]
MKDRRRQGTVRLNYTKLLALIRTVDSLIIVLSLELAIRLVNQTLDTWYVLNDGHRYCALAGVLLFQFFADYYEVYYAWRGASQDNESVRLGWSWFCAMAAIMALLACFKSGVELSLFVTAAWFCVSFLALILVHELGRGWLAFLRRRGLNSRRVVIAGANDLGARLAGAFAAMPWLGYCFAGYYDDRGFQQGRRLACPERLYGGDFNTLVQRARDGEIDEIFIAMPMRSEQRVAELMNLLSDTTASVYYVPDVFVFNLVRSRLDMVQGIPCITVHGSPFKHQPVDGFLKRAEDVVLSFAILALIAVPMVLIATAVKLDSPGPVLFKQKRYGMSGEPIEVWKFRTMTVQENGATVTQATRNDARITRLGGFLRRYSLDELPQFINVLQGRMSIVGPRPHAVAHNEYYRKQINGYMLRHTIKPGITGLAQINGCRGETDTLDKMERRVVYDLEYISHWQVWLDLKIIFLTIFRVAHDPNAY